MMLEFAIHGIHPVSTNDMYLPRPCRGGKHAYLTSSSQLKKFHKEVEDLLQDLITDEQVEQLTEELSDRRKVIELSVVFLLGKSGFFGQDTSNIIKALEDSIVNRIHIDDKRNCRIILEKRLSDDGEDHFLVKMGVYDIGHDLEREWK